MAKMVSELGADVFDDTQVEQKKSRLTKKQKNYILGLSLTAILAILLGVVYYFAATVWLIDFSNMPYIQYAYNALPDENGEITAQISRVKRESNYPSDFRIPAEINGYRITKIADNAFAGCTRIKTITMTDNIEYIGEQAFAGCNSLTKIKFSKNVDHIGNKAFLDTPYFDNLPKDKIEYVNEVLINIGEELLGEKTALVSNPTRDIQRIHNYLDQGLTVFDMDSFSILTKENIANYDAQAATHSNISQWIDGLFENYDTIKVVEIPETLHFVPIQAFKNCNELEKVYINSDLITEICESAFEGCTKLSEVSLPNKLKIISNNAFKGTNVSINTLPSTIEQIGESAFENCDAITSFTYPYNEGVDTLNYVPNFAFKGCDNLANFEFANPDHIRSIGTGAFSGTALTSFRIPKNVTNLSDELFLGCEKLEYVEMFDNTSNKLIPGTEYVDRNTHKVVGTLQGIENIYGGVFKNCENFTSIKLYDDDGNITKYNEGTLHLPVTLKRTATSSIGLSVNETFAGTKIKEVIFPLGIINIGSYLFSDVTTLENVKFQDTSASSSLISINEGAFMGCTGLKTFTVPDSVSKIEMKAFQNCSGLTEIHLPEPATTKGGFTSVNQNLFDGCTSLKTINLRYGITQIAKEAFKNCSSLRTLYIPVTTNNIHITAFEGTVDLTVTSPIIGDEPSKWSSDGTSWYENKDIVLVKSLESTYEGKDGTKKYEIGFLETSANELQISVLETKRSGTNVVVPAEFTDEETNSTYSITSVGRYAFAGNADIVSIRLPKTIKSIGYRAFIDCSSLETIYFEGTKDEWDNIEKDIEWNHNLPANYNVVFPEDAE